MANIFHKAPTEYLRSINDGSFNEIARELFLYQYEHNEIYRAFVEALHIDTKEVRDITQIPFLPVHFFRTHRVVTGDFEPEVIFESSSTTSDTSSKHYVKSVELYKESLLQGFCARYGDVAGYTILALLPSYLERENASLVFMAKTLMEHSNMPHNGFYLDEFEKLSSVLTELEQEGQPVLLLGVTFALLDFADAYPIQLFDTIVMETGGMKGRRAELTREQVHQHLKTRLGVQYVHSEYGMTELLSQAYAPKDGIFIPSKKMKVLIRDINDPLEVKLLGSGCLNIIDLANVHSCAFIATDDLGVVQNDGTFNVLGRLDNSILRGCNLMVI